MPPRSSTIALVTNEPPSPIARQTSADVDRHLAELEREHGEALLRGDEPEAVRVETAILRARERSKRLLVIEHSEREAARKAQEAAEQAARDATAQDLFRAHDYRPEMDEIDTRLTRIVDDLRTIMTELAPRAIAKSNKGREAIQASGGSLADGQGFYYWNRAYDQLPIGCVAQAGAALPAVVTTQDVTRWAHTRWMERELATKGISLAEVAADQSRVLRRLGLPDGFEQWLPNLYRRP